MASQKEYLDYIIEQLSDLEEISYLYMMGEYAIYYKGKVLGGIFDNRFLVKNVSSAQRLMPDTSLEIPYPKGKPMLLVDNVDNREFLSQLFNEMYDEVSFPPSKKKKQLYRR